MSEAGSHQYLATQSTYHLSADRATREVLRVLKLLEPNRRTKDLRRATFQWAQFPNRGSTFAALVAETRATGFAGPAQLTLEARDPWFGDRFDLSVDSEGIDLASSYAGFESSGRGPACSHRTEVGLAGDIVAARLDLCSATTKGRLDWVQIARSYRTFLFACTALVEAFLNHHVLVAGHVGRDMKAFESALSFEDRLERWLSEFTTLPLSELKGSESWGHLVELRKARNRSIHGAEPALSLSLRDLPRTLNAAKTGVGDLLAGLRARQDLPPTSFILAVQTAPKIEFRSARPRGGRSR